MNVAVRLDEVIKGTCLRDVDRLLSASDEAATVFVDIDGTIITEDNEPNHHVLSLMKYLHERKARIFLWSAGGEDNCRRTAKRYGIEDMIEYYLPKPMISIDDMRYDDYVFLKLHPCDLSDG